MSSAHGPLVVGVADLLREPGSQREVQVEVEVDEIGVARSTVPAGTPVTVDLVLESTLGEAVTAHGTVAGPWQGECRRCLEPIEGTMAAEVTELFERRPTDEDSYPIVDDAVDLGPVVHDALVLALPLVPLCRADCPGPSPDAYPVSVESDDPGDRPPDERWSVLEGLVFDEPDDT